MRSRQKLVATSKHSIKCPYPMKPEYITVHNTYNDASAENEISYMCSNNNSTSFHFAVDDKETIQGIPFNRNAWHCGDGNGKGNRQSIGIEICYSKSGGERYRKAEANAAKYIAKLLKERNWDVSRVKKHQDWSGKHCPHRILAEGRWNAFIQEIKKELNGVSTKTKVLKTGGFRNEVDIAKLVRFLIDRNWWAKMQTFSDGLEVETGGLNTQNLAEIESFFKTNNWWYEIKEV
jgi:N-acetylmuramoyl-L-alanine amidase